MDATEKSIFSAVLISAVVLGIIIFYFIISMIRQQRRNLELHRLNILAEINTLEKERSRVATDLHDDLGPVLSAIKFKINSIEVSDKEDQFQLSDASMQLDHLIGRVREIAYNLMPSALLRKGLLAALQDFVRNFEDSNLKIHFSHNELPEISEQVAIHSFRIIQEVVHNTIKHAKATELKIMLIAENRFLHIRCQDDGIGFNQQKAQQHAGIGLTSLNSRSSIMGGSMDIQSSPNKGTHLNFKIPI